VVVNADESSGVLENSTSKYESGLDDARCDSTFGSGEIRDPNVCCVQKNDLEHFSFEIFQKWAVFPEDIGGAAKRRRRLARDPREAAAQFKRSSQTGSLCRPDPLVTQIVSDSSRSHFANRGIGSQKRLSHLYRTPIPGARSNNQGKKLGVGENFCSVIEQFLTRKLLAGICRHAFGVYHSNRPFWPVVRIETPQASVRNPQFVT